MIQEQEYIKKSSNNMDFTNANILVVEDNPIIGMYVKELLTQLKYSVVAVHSNVEGALDEMERSVPDLALVDINLTGELTGIDFVRKIKEKGDFPVVYMSSSTDDDQIRNAEETFPSGYLQKPIDEQQLATTVKIALRRFAKKKEEFKKLEDFSKLQEINIQELSETNAHLITATWRERELKNELQKTKEIIEIQNKKIMDSINYAQRIQGCIAPEKESLDEYLGDHFLFYKPKDVVSGDFPWLYKREDYIYFAAVDCTGHGVPGAMMSMIGNLLLNDVVNNEVKMKTPAEVLAMLHYGVVKTLKQDNPENKAADGMDIALCRISVDRKEMMFSGAHLPMYLLRGSELIEYKGSRFPVGGMQYRNRNTYNDNVVDIQKGDKVFIFSDGMIDQIGGPENKKWMSTGLKEFIVENANLSMQEFGVKIEEKYYEWMGLNKQVDDVILFGVKI